MPEQFITITNQNITFNGKTDNTTYARFYLDYRLKSNSKTLIEIAKKSHFTSDHKNRSLRLCRNLHDFIHNSIMGVKNGIPCDALLTNILNELGVINFGTKSNIIFKLQSANNPEQLAGALRNTKEFIHLLALFVNNSSKI